MFEIKLKMWINQIVPCRYRPPAPMAISTDPTGSNGDGIASPGRAVAVKAARASTSAAGGGTDRTLVGTGQWTGGNATC
jgi:hypothetical protein